MKHARECAKTEKKFPYKETIESEKLYLMQD